MQSTKCKVKIEDKLVKVNLVHSIIVMDHNMRVSHGKEGLHPSMSSEAMPLRGKVTQDTIQEVQSQDMESRGAITKVETTRYKDRNPRHQVIRQGEVLVKRVLSPHIPSREF